MCTLLTGKFGANAAAVHLTTVSEHPQLPDHCHMALHAVGESFLLSKYLASSHSAYADCGSTPTIVAPKELNVVLPPMLPNAPPPPGSLGMPPSRIDRPQSTSRALATSNRPPKLIYHLAAPAELQALSLPSVPERSSFPAKDDSTHTRFLTSCLTV